MKKARYDINFRVRSAVLIRDMDMTPQFEVLCYGWTHSDLATVDLGGDGSGGTQVARRLEARGIDMDRLTMTVFDTRAL